MRNTGVLAADASPTAGEIAALGAMVVVVGAASAVTVGSAAYVLIGGMVGGMPFIRNVPHELRIALARRDAHQPERRAAVVIPAARRPVWHGRALPEVRRPAPLS